MNLIHPNISLIGKLKLNQPPYSAEDPRFHPLFADGKRPPPSSGGTSSFAWSAPKGLIDGRDIIISSDIHALIQPRTVVDFGLGDGWLASAADGTKFKSITISTVKGNAALNYQDSGAANPRREVVTRNGQKALKATLSSIVLENGNAGYINFDTGAEIAPGEHSFMWSSTQHTLSAADAGKLCQIKQDRVGPSANANDPENEVYIKQDNASGSPVAFDCYLGPTSNAKAFFIGSHGPRADGLRTDFGWCWKINTPDLEDGSIVNACGKGTGPLGRPLAHHSTAPNNPTGVIKTTSTFRPRWQKHQGYVGIGNGTIEIESLEELLYSFFWQVNGYVIVIGDSPAWENCTRWTPLKPVEFISANSWRLKLYKGAIGSYTGGGIFLFNPTDLNTPIASAAL